MRFNKYIEEHCDGKNEIVNEVKIIKTGELTFNKKVTTKLKKLFPNGKISKKHVPQIGDVLYVKDSDGKILGKAIIDRDIKTKEKSVNIYKG